MLTLRRWRDGALLSVSITHGSQLKLSDGQRQGFLKFWKAQKGKVHEARVRDALWGPRLKAFSWRIDVKTKSKHIRDLNEPTAIVELDVASTTSGVRVTGNAQERERERERKRHTHSGQRTWTRPTPRKHRHGCSPGVHRVWQGGTLEVAVGVGGIA
jgi:hypothetical protein